MDILWKLLGKWVRPFVRKRLCLSDESQCATRTIVILRNKCNVTVPEPMIAPGWQRVCACVCVVCKYTCVSLVHATIWQGVRTGRLTGYNVCVSVCLSVCVCVTNACVCVLLQGQPPTITHVIPPQSASASTDARHMELVIHQTPQTPLCRYLPQPLWALCSKTPFDTCTAGLNVSVLINCV